MTPTEELLRGLAPQVLGVLVRRFGRFDLAEDAVQEALPPHRSAGRRTASLTIRARGWSRSGRAG